MAIDYVLFLHGVDVRSEDYADTLIGLIKSEIPDSSSSLVTIPIYYGDLSDQQEARLLDAYEQAPIWLRLWFPHLRTGKMLRFAGDAALYLSRYTGGAIADLIWAKAKYALSSAQPDDHLHLVTHSLGTVILFDMLFSARWDGPPSLPGYWSVQSLRDALYGISGASQGPYVGIQLGSVTTMGSPIGIFSLMDVDKSTDEVRDANSNPLASHDITPRLQVMLDYLRARMGGENLLWRNYLHPGDPIGSPLKIVLPELLGYQGRYVDVDDILVPSHLGEILEEPYPDNLVYLLGELFGSSDASILASVDAHSSYWHSRKVARDIANTILESRLRAICGQVRTFFGLLGTTI